MVVRLFHIILSLTVLLSTTGLTLSEHHCKKEMESAKAAAQSEGTAQEGVTCSGDGGCEKGCCSNDYEYFQSDQDKQVQNFEFKQLKQPELLATILVVFNIQLPFSNTAQSDFETYRPPIVRKDILTLFQTFLC